MCSSDLGHLPDFMIKDELESGALKSIVGKYLSGLEVEICALRRHNSPVGPVADRLWHDLQSGGL